jgi:hypothetical protein
MSALLATRGKGGSVESISQAGKHFSNDKTLTPSDFITVDKLDASKAITLLGGYAVSTYGFEPKVAYSMKEAFAKKYVQVVDLFDLSKTDFISAIDEIKAGIAADVKDKQDLAISIGKVDVQASANAIKNIEAILNAQHPEVAYNLQIIAKLVNDKIAYAPLQKVAQVA